MTTRYNFGNPGDRGDDFAREPHDAYPVDEYPAAVPADLDGTDDADDAADYVEFEDIDAEYADDRYAAVPVVDDYRGSHRRDADEEYEDYDEYAEYADDREYADDDNTSVIPGAASAAGAATVGAAGTAAASTRGKRGDGEVRGKGRRQAKSSAGSSAVAAGGVPKRGLAMILIAVAALLLLWGIYAMTQNRGADNDAAPAATTTAATETVANTGAPDAGAGAGAGQTGAQNATAADGANPQDPNAPRADDPNAPAPAPAPAAGGTALTAANAEVFVFNNSGVPNAASDTAARLDPQFNVANNSPDPATMNMPEQQYGVFPETTVFFDPQVPGAEQVAADIAQRVGGVPRANNDLPQGTTGLPEPAAGNSNAITVVLAG